jgi:hypothetical protein
MNILKAAKRVYAGGSRPLVQIWYCGEDGHGHLTEAQALDCQHKRNSARGASGSEVDEPLRKIRGISRSSQIEQQRSVLVDAAEASLLARQARQRVAHPVRVATASRIEVGTGDTQQRRQADREAAVLFKASRLPQIVPGFFAGMRQ